jgi:hypothetical protein
MIKARLKHRRWAVVLIASLAAAGVLTLVALGVVVLFARLNSANEDVAIGDVFGGGLFLLGVIAGALSVVAYLESLHQPELRTELQWRSPGDGNRLSPNQLPRDPGFRAAFAGSLPPGVTANDLVPLEQLTLAAQINNDGDAAAKNVAVAVYLKGVYFDPPLTAPAGSLWTFDRMDAGWRLKWEGGEAAPIYAGDIPRTPSVQLTGMWVLANNDHTNLGGVATFADALKGHVWQALKVDAAP